MLLNSARIDNCETNFYFYSKGISKETSNLHEEIDRERLNLGKAVAYNLICSVEILG
jgi:hypothetical protein